MAKISDGRRIAEAAVWMDRRKLARDINRVIRERMAEAWAAGHEYGGITDPDLDANDANPYLIRGRKRKA